MAVVAGAPQTVRRLPQSFYAAMLACSVAMLALAIALSSGASGRPTSSPVGVSVHSAATAAQPTTYYVLRGTPESIDAAVWMNGGPFDNLVLVESPEAEDAFFRFVETANSFLLAGGLPGYQVVNLTR